MRIGGAPGQELDVYIGVTVGLASVAVGRVLVGVEGIRVRVGIGVLEAVATKLFSGAAPGGSRTPPELVF
jgi:hypothetical protein